MGIGNFPPGSSSFSCLSHQCVIDWLGHSSSSSHSSRNLVSEREGPSQMKLVQHALNAFLPRILGVGHSHERQCHSSDSSEEAIEHCFQGDVQLFTGDCGLDRTAPGDPVLR